MPVPNTLRPRLPLPLQNIFVGLENVDQYASMFVSGSAAPHCRLCPPARQARWPPSPPLLPWAEGVPPLLPPPPQFNLGYGRLNVTVKPSSYYYSWGVSVSPPAWRPAAPAAWGIDPQALGAVGYTSPVTQLSGTSATGSVYVEGPLAGGRAANQLRTPDVLFEIGSQGSWWGMLRDLNRRAVSMGLATAPDLLLWNRVRLPFRRAWKGPAWGRRPGHWLARGGSTPCGLCARKHCQCAGVCARCAPDGSHAPSACVTFLLHMPAPEPDCPPPPPPQHIHTHAGRSR
jgi:hypothetical protein